MTQSQVAAAAAGRDGRTSHQLKCYRCLEAAQWTCARRRPELLPGAGQMLATRTQGPLNQKQAMDTCMARCSRYGFPWCGPRDAKRRHIAYKGERACPPNGKEDFVVEERRGVGGPWRRALEQQRNSANLLLYQRSCGSRRGTKELHERLLVTHLDQAGGVSLVAEISCLRQRRCAEHVGERHGDPQTAIDLRRICTAKNLANSRC
mmetsp:Transcript_14882/g.29914  ORF Transcript_14882/g.29914 Transcript_14882/m.29914 type:complete len:206 (+) Transcript_14882:151-768(+)